MCCGNWRFIGALALLSITIFFVSPGWDTAAIATGFTAATAGIWWLNRRGSLDAACALPQRQETAPASETRSAELKAQREDLRAREDALSRELVALEFEGERKRQPVSDEREHMQVR